MWWMPSTFGRSRSVEQGKLRGLSGLSGLSRNTNTRLTLTVHLLGPLGGKTPCWVRAARLHYSHAAFEVDNKLWDQPCRGRCCVRNADDWLSRKVWVVPRKYAAFRVTAWVDWPIMTQAVESLEGKRGIPLLIALRWLHLWPLPVWNCVSSVRTMLNAMGLPTRAETPDALFNYLRLCTDIAPAIPRLAPSVEQIAGGSSLADSGTD